MNIVVFTDTFLPKIDGVAISVERFSKLLAERGHNIVICAPRYGDDDAEDLGERIKIIRFKNAPLPSYPEIKVVLPSQKKIRKAMTLWPPDVVHIQSPGLLGQYGVVAAKMYGVPLVGTYHTLVSEQETYISIYRLLKIDSLLDFFSLQKNVKKRLDKIERKPEKSLKKTLIMKAVNTMYDTCRLVISPSHLIRQELIESGMRSPIEVVSNGMDLLQFSGTPKNLQGDAPKLLHVGRISYEKNCEVILKAFALIRQKKPGATLSIIGDGPALTSLKIEAEQLGIQDAVRFPGFVNHADLGKIYPQYDMFLTASTMETQGLVVLEAMACGLPCVGVDSFALPELIQNGRNGFIAQPFDHIQIADSTLQMLNDPALYHRFSVQSLEIAKEHDIHTCTDRLEAVYRMLMEGKI